MTDDRFHGSDYEIVAWARGQDVLYYERFGDYQGDWMILARDAARTYFVYHGSYGSCSGCDSYQAHFDYQDTEGGITREQAWEFAKDYPPFIEIPRDTMRNLVTNRTLMTVMPRNVRDGGWGDIPYEQVVTDWTVLARLDEGVPIDIDDVFNARNQDIRRRALDRYGRDRFVHDVGDAWQVIDRDGPDELVRIRDLLFLWVMDRSTDRRYLLGVPNGLQGVREAKAWSFGIPEAQYAPVRET